MELFVLNSTYNPGDTVQNFDTLAWTERYQNSGDFQLVAIDDISVLSDLPKGSLISHTDTKEVMIVENHEIERDAKKVLRVAISGRSFETFAENRVTAGSETPLYTAGVANVETIAAAASATIATTLLKGRLEPGTASAANAVPNLIVRSNMRALDTAMTQVIKRGDVYSRAIELLRLCDGGIQMIRPNGAQTTMDLVVHDGVDRIASVIFYAQYEDLEDAKYFWSDKIYKNYAAIATDITARVYRDRALGADVNGLLRRVMYVEAADLKGVYSPPTATDVVASRAQAGIDENIQISLMTAQISKTAKPKFKLDYDVGDLVTVFGEFATAQIMRVTEHILTFDKKTGMQGYPSLTAI